MPHLNLAKCLKYTIISYHCNAKQTTKEDYEVIYQDIPKRNEF